MGVEKSLLSKATVNVIIFLVGTHTIHSSSEYHHLIKEEDERDESGKRIKQASVSSFLFPLFAVHSLPLHHMHLYGIEVRIITEMIIIYGYDMFAGWYQKMVFSFKQTRCAKTEEPSTFGCYSKARCAA